MNKNIIINYIDISSIKTPFTNSVKAWKEVLESVRSIEKNFNNNKISPEEISEILELDKNSKGIPDQSSIENIRISLHRVKNEYKISLSNSLFYEFDRVTAVYLFSIGLVEQSLDILNNVMNSLILIIETTKDNLDLTLICLRDCIKINIASIYFWTQRYEESKKLIDDILITYETSDDELYLIKMSNFVHVALCYLGWYYINKELYDDAEKAFYHSLNVLDTVKKFTIESGDPDFIYTKDKKIFCYDQLINFYSLIGKYDLVKKPLKQILTIMDKSKFYYSIDINAINHINYYLCLILLNLKDESFNIQTILLYLSEVIKITDNNSICERLSNNFFKIYFKIIEIFKLNEYRNIFELNASVKNYKKGKVESIKKILNDLCETIDEILAYFEFEGILTFDPNNQALSDTTVTIIKYLNVFEITDKSFNAIELINEKYDKKIVPVEKDKTFILNEISFSEYAFDKCLYKYAIILNDLVDCNFIKNGLVLKNFTGFMHITDDELNYFLIEKISCKTTHYKLYKDTIINVSEVEKEKEKISKFDEIINLVKPKKIETKFAPLYYKRVRYKIGKVKGYSFSFLMAVINLLYSLNLYYPMITILSNLINSWSYEMNEIYKNLNEDEISVETEGIILLYEFLIILCAEAMTKEKLFENAIKILNCVVEPFTEANSIAINLYKGICLNQLKYYDLSTYYLAILIKGTKNVLQNDKDKFVNLEKDFIKKNEDQKDDNHIIEEGNL